MGFGILQSSWPLGQKGPPRGLEVRMSFVSREGTRTLGAQRPL